VLWLPGQQRQHQRFRVPVQHCAFEHSHDTRRYVAKRYIMELLAASSARKLWYVESTQKKITWQNVGKPLPRPETEQTSDEPTIPGEYQHRQIRLMAELGHRPFL
jgi:hypothetical protein